MVRIGANGSLERIWYAKKPIFLSRFMISIFLLWFVQTSVMPLFVGAVTGALAALVWGRSCAASTRRRALWAGLAAWAAHLAVVGGGFIREGSVWDYGVVALVSVVASELACRRRRTTRKG